MFIPAYSEQSQIEPSPDVHQLIINKQIVIYPYNEIIKESLENLKINPSSVNGMDIENLKKESSIIAF